MQMHRPWHIPQNHSHYVSCDTGKGDPYSTSTLYSAYPLSKHSAAITSCKDSLLSSLSPRTAEMYLKLKDSTHREKALDLLADRRYSGHNKTKWHQYLLGRHYKSTGVPVFWSLESAETFHRAVPCSESALIQHLRPFYLAVCRSPLLLCIWHHIWLAKNLTLSLCLIHRFLANFGLSFLCFS